MGATAPVISKVSIPEYKKVIIETSNGKRYYTDLNIFSRVYCFPKSELEWRKVAPDSSGLALIWSSRFEAHVDQIIALATKIEDITKTA